MTTGNRFPVVGIGASAGGLQALDGFFHSLSDSTGMAFVIVTHLPTGRVSALPEILARYTKMPVVEASHHAVVRPDHVYVCPPDRALTIQSGRLRLVLPDADLRHFPIDQFLISLAEDRQDAAIGVLLSGGGSDGTLGLRAIKDVGGITIAQGSNGSAPSHSGMPNAAIAAGVVDLVLPVEQIARRLAAFARGPEAPEAAETGSGSAPGAAGTKTLETISAVLLDRIGHDFSGYKPKTFLRRVRRRMQVLQLDSPEAYIAHLRKDGDEASLLFRDLLIGVTSFFRDPAAFEALEQEIIPRLFENKAANGELRVWVPGCASGEEAYSIAILLREHMDTLRAVPSVQIFATDINEASLDIARAGRYAAAALGHVSKRRLQRFFTGDDGHYTVSKDIRGMCTFSPHNVLQDPPFSRLDLISCRNVFIYFGAAFQARVLPLFHFALRPGGYLFLGTSENVSQHADLFSTTDKRNRIYQRRDGAVPPLAFRRGQSAAAMASVLAPPVKPGGRTLADLRKTVEGRVLERFAPAHVVINRDFDVLYYSARTGKYLEAAQGLPSRQLLAMARKGLRLALRTLLREAVETRRTVEHHGLGFEIDGRVQTIDLVIEPFGDSEQDPLFLVLFRDLGAPVDAEARQPGRERSDKVIDQVERELRETRERLQVTVEEYETAVEELKSSNEELQSINEELQSTNEELETSKEELQSVNEELNTVNAELSNKVEELDRANADLRNVFESTGVAIVFLDRDLRIRSFTPAATAIFKLISGDSGRPLTDIANDLAEPGDLGRDVQSVFEQGRPIERRVHHVDGRTHYVMRILPYLNERGVPDGVLVVFVNVTRLVENEGRQRAILEDLNAGVQGLLGRIAALSESAPTKDASAAQFQDAFVGRLHALSACYALLAQAKWRAVSLGDILGNGLAAHRLAGAQDRIVLDGPAVRFAAPQALALAMVIHELADDAVRHGALSGAEGRLSVTWEIRHRRGRADMLELEWQESGGPRVARPRQKSFGRRLVEREVEGALHGTVRVAYGQSGMRVRLSVPLDAEDDSGRDG